MRWPQLTEFWPKLALLMLREITTTLREAGLDIVLLTTRPFEYDAKVQVSEKDLKDLASPDPLLKIPKFQIGKIGVEKWMEDTLRGEAGTKRIEVNSVGRVMREHLYDLQYHLYTVALHQYLRRRLTGYDYGRDFGGVCYVFVRGVDPAVGPEYGLFCDRPEPHLIHALGRTLITDYA